MQHVKGYSDLLYQHISVPQIDLKMESILMNSI